LVYLPGWSAADLMAGPHPADGVFDSERGTTTRPLSGEIRFEADGDALVATLDLAGERVAVTGTAVATPTPCPGPSRRSGAGPSSVRYALRGLDGSDYDGTFTYARVLAGVRGMEREPVDLLLLQVAPSIGCDPQPDGLHEGAYGAWFLTGLPREGTRTFGRGNIVKVWTWEPGRGDSHNLELGGSVQVDPTSDAHEVRGVLAVTLPGGGVLDGPFRAPVEDCSAWRGPYPF
ncbi:MAG: hypothetical protein ABMA64_05915, partial [Myxococcota bacterium]